MPEGAATPVPMPRLGATMDEGVLLEWLKGEGDRVAEHEPLFEVETDKAVVQVESPVAGVVRSLLVKPGTVVPVGEAVALVAPEGAADEGPRVQAGDAPSAPPAPAVSTGAVPGAASSAAEALSPSAAPAPAAVPQAGGAVHAGPSPVVDGVRLRMTPAARRLMRELGVDLATLRALAARGGRITRQILLSAWEGRAAAPAAPAPAPAPALVPASVPARTASAPLPAAPPAAAGTGPERVPLSPMRRAIARAMSRSAQEIPQFSVSRTVDMAEVMEAVRALGAWSTEAPTVTDFLIQALAHALHAHPDMNAHMEGEDVLLRWPEIRLGLATATEAGLMVPAIRVGPDTPLGEISRLRRAAVAQAKAGRMGADEPTFTLSNLGPFAVDRFVALVNPPQVAILAAGAVTPRPAVREGEVVVRPAVDLTVSADHRAVDGAEVARFLATVADFLGRRDAWRLF